LKLSAENCGQTAAITDPTPITLSVIEEYTVHMGEPTKGGGCELDTPIDLMRDIAVTC